MRRLTALLVALLLLAFTGCAANPSQPESTSSPAQADETQADFQVESAYPLEYAKEFTVDECTGGTRLITIQNARYLVVPENGTVRKTSPFCRNRLKMSISFPRLRWTRS